MSPRCKKCQAPLENADGAIGVDNWLCKTCTDLGAYEEGMITPAKIQADLLYMPGAKK